MRTKTKLAVAAAAALALACAGPEKKSGPDLATLEGFCSAIMATNAGTFAACYQATPAYTATFQTARGSCDEMASFVAAGRVRYSPGDAATCLAAFAAAPCDGLDHAQFLTPACATFVTGTVAPGGSCALSEECAGGTCDTTATCSGACVALLAAGADCRTVPADCAQGLLCDYQGSGTCVAPAPGSAGQACGPGDLPCHPGLFCDGGVCGAKLTAGASCLGVTDPYPCAPGAFCHQDSFFSPTRAECVPWVGAGAACGEWTGNCGPGLNCLAGACAPDPTLGEPCSPTVPCLLGSWCDGGTCAAPKPLGASCSRYDQCALEGSAFCDGTTCVAEPVCSP